MQQQQEDLDKVQPISHFQDGYAVGQQFVLNPWVVQDIQESCSTKVAMSVIAGGGLGFLFGAFFRTGMFSAAEAAPQNLSLGKQVIEGFRESGRAGWGTAKTFGAVGAVFTGSECIVERGRAKCDIYNSVAAGCFSGAILAANQGAKAQAMGCVGFAAFSVVIDEITQRHGSKDTMAVHDDFHFSATPTYLSDEITAEDLITPPPPKQTWAEYLHLSSPPKPEANKNTAPSTDAPVPQEAAQPEASGMSKEKAAISSNSVPEITKDKDFSFSKNPTKDL